MEEQPQPERKIELCTPNIVDLPIINLQDTGRPFKIKIFDEDGVTQDQMRAWLFPFSLHGKALR
jgi:hypothetical protein